MKHIVLVGTCFLILASCATTRVSKKITPVGDWDYEIKNTPEGDFSGVMTISLQNEVYTAKLNTAGNELPFEKFNWDATTKTVTGFFYYSGTPVDFTAVLNEEQLTGTMAAGGGEFIFSARRKPATK